MASIYFVGPYQPILCGIGDYTVFLARSSPPGKWAVLSFDLTRYGVPLMERRGPKHGHIWYGIPDRHSYGAAAIRQGLDALGAREEQSVLWFQHEFGIWPHKVQFADMLKHLDMPKVVTFHTLHFQSAETPFGLKREEYDLLHLALPYVDAITVFTRGVYRAVTVAFPEHAGKVHIIRHGVHSYPGVSRLTRQEAKERLNDYLLFDSDLDSATKEELYRQRILLDPATVVIGQTGFLSPAKGSELLPSVRDSLQAMVPGRRIAAIRIGKSREEGQEAHAQRLLRLRNRRLSFLLRVWLPQDMLPVAQKAFDINFYWPGECTQSGVLAHALGAGAVVAGRDLEGVGETLREAGAIVDTSLGRLTTKMRAVLLDPDLAEAMAERALGHAARFSWERQARRHYHLAERVLRPGPVRSRSPLPAPAPAPTTPTGPADTGTPVAVPA